MSEPRKLHTGNAHQGAAPQSAEAARSVLSQQQFEDARRRAQMEANRNVQRRVVRRPAAQSELTRRRMEEQRAAERVAAEQRAAEQAAREAAEREAAERAAAERAAARRAEAEQAAREEAEREARRAAAERRRLEDSSGLTPAQRQSIAYRAAVERKYGNTVRFPAQRSAPAPEQSRAPAPEQAAAPRTERQAQPAAQRTVRRPEQERPAAPARVMPEQEPEQKPVQKVHRRAEEQAPRAKRPTQGTRKAAAGGNGSKPPRKGEAPQGKKGGKAKKKKKKGGWWKILLATMLVIVLIFGGTLALIKSAIAPQAGGIKLSQLLNTPKEFQDDEFNFVMVGIDRSTQKEGDVNNEAEVNDGNTDMILYVHFNNVTGEMKMLQIPRDTMVTTDRSISGNYRINNIAKTQAASANTMNIPALCKQISEMYKLPVDGYITIRLEMLVEMVDLFGGVELYVPQTMDYKGSHLDQGYQTLNGDACEFLLRARHVYPDGDIGRLNMQRQFYSALFRKLKSIGNVWDVAKLTPAVLNYMETDLSISKLVSFAVSMLKIDSSKIMICQMPVKMGMQYNGQSVVYSARQEDADLLNQYFRENTGYVDASELQLCDSPSVLGFDLSGLPSTDPNVQFMQALNDQATDAQQNENLDGSHTVEYADPVATPAPMEGGEGAEGAEGGDAASPAA